MNVSVLWIAAFMSFVTFSVHTFIGGPRVAAPLLADTSLPKASKWLNYYCWHITTIYTFSMGVALAYVAMTLTAPELVVFISVINALFAILSAVVAMMGKINPFRFPSTSLFASVAILGITSLLI